MIIFAELISLPPLDHHNAADATNINTIMTTTETMTITTAISIIIIIIDNVIKLLIVSYVYRQVVCGSCSSQKAPLQYDENRAHRVCDACHIILNKSSEYAEDDEDIYGVIDQLRKDRTKTRSILKVSS